MALQTLIVDNPRGRKVAANSSEPISKIPRHSEFTPTSVLACAKLHPDAAA